MSVFFTVTLAILHPVSTCGILPNVEVLKYSVTKAPSMVVCEQEVQKHNDMGDNSILTSDGHVFIFSSYCEQEI